MNLTHELTKKYTLPVTNCPEKQKADKGCSLPQSTAHRLVIHVRLVLVDAPQTRDGL